ncbi:uncharacterized protein LOC105179418 [Sesamum indicum]|uniref:Uncharacterized protein LOC105179418 n=1 Tax=Sesamum indicum TaxID=4182 RepID=A0A6I9V145_SESIN|nr:uncharacterized protein LOC105179418 [Sesamum indicum]
MEQIMLQQRAKMQWIKDEDQCSRVFFCKIVQRCATRRILQINDEHGTTYLELGAVINEFVSFYQALLSGERRRQVIDIRYLRPWARHVLNEEEGLQLLTLVTVVDVKHAVFDIVEDKAPGPDGFSSDFCYNQARLPPRCALKVDIRKAYDTVEWDFLFAVLHLFGFPTTFIRWIEKCVTTPSFSVRLNGKPHGFFTGSRWLRQGDPLSPYLFVFIMELRSADDLLLLCKADMNSTGVFKQGLDLFASWSGLRLNVHKSHLIIS